MNITDFEMNERVQSEYDWERGYKAGVHSTMRLFKARMDNLTEALEELRRVFNAYTPDAQ